MMRTHTYYLQLLLSLPSTAMPDNVATRASEFLGRDEGKAPVNEDTPTTFEEILEDKQMSHDLFSPDYFMMVE